MKKVLILSYFFPPCNLTASQRALSYATFLKSNNYDPVIVTRNWEHPVSEQRDMSKKAGKDVIIENHDSHEVHYVPFKPGMRDRLFAKYGERKFSFLRKFLTIWELFLQNFSIGALPYSNMYRYTEKLLSNTPEIKYVIIIANPFPLFHFGYKLQKKFQDIQWIADYRDDWTTNELSKPKGIIGRILTWRNRKSEQKWVNSAVLATTVSQMLVDRISNILYIPVHLIANGFFNRDYKNISNSSKTDEFIISYTGAIYHQQDIESMAIVMKALIDRFGQKIKLIIRFIGAEYDAVAMKRLQKLFKGMESHLQTTPRISNDECLKLESGADLLYMTSYGNLKGIPASKLYQYLGHRKPVLLFPTDSDIMEQTLKECQVGVIIYDKKEAVEKIAGLIEKKMTYKALPVHVNEIAVRKYSRKEQVKKMAGLLNQLD